MSQDIEIKYKQARIAPFWKKLPFFFVYPFRFGPLVFLLCIVGASAIAGMALGTFSLVFRGLLVFLGLRYAFNVLALFSRGRFEGESPDVQLWGRDGRPAKLGLVLALFIAGGLVLGDFALQRRIARDPAAQERIIALYRQAHAEEIAEYERELKEYQQRQAERAALARAPAPREGDEPAGAATPDFAQEPEPEEEPPLLRASREDMLRAYWPRFGDPLWFQLQPAWYWLALVALSFMLPSAAVVIALEDSFFRALNPLNTLHLIGAMGSAYFVLWAFFLAIAGGRHAAFTLGQDWPAMMRFPAEMALVSYLGLVLFALMGYALYQFHQELHLDVDVDFDEHREAGGAEAIAAAGSARAAVRAVTAPVDPWERKLQELEAAGNFREAIAEVKDRMRYAPDDLPLNARLHAVYLRQGERDAILAHGQQYLGALARAGRGREALEVLRKLQALDPAFQPQDGDVTLPAAAAAFQQGDTALAAALVRGFDKRFPQHRDTPAVFFLGARLLSETSRQHAQAARILRAVLHHFPEHALAAEVRTYLQVLENTMLKEAAAA